MDLLTSTSIPPIKAFKVGKQGHGKTGADASLIALGYKLRMLNFDNGADILRNLLTNPHYSYSKYMKEKNIPLKGSVSVITIAEEMQRKVEDNKSRFVPKRARGYSLATDMLDNWIDGEDKYGSIMTWGPDVILSIDTLGTLADLAYFQIQELNGRLGERQEGNNYRRDVGGAQGLLRNLMQTLFHPLVKCNILINSHVTYVDESKGSYDSPSKSSFESSDSPSIEALSAPIGYPQAIGRAISPVIGKWFNNVLIIEESGTGLTKKNEIVTISSKNIAAKSSLPGVLKSRYPIETGMAQIFCALRGEPEPKELMEMCLPKRTVAAIPIKTKTTAA